MDLLELPGVPFPLRSEGPRTAPRPEAVPGGVRVFAGPRADLFLDPAGAPPGGSPDGSPGASPDAERFVAEVEGDFRFRAHVVAGFHADFDSGVLLGYADARNWFKICAEVDPGGVARVVTVVTRDGASDDANAWPLDGPGVHLRISRTGRTFALHASADGETWAMVRYFAMGAAATAPVRVGLLAQSPRGEGTSATFTAAAFDRSGLTDLRDGT